VLQYRRTLADWVFHRGQATEHALRTSASISKQ
jgi:hypothetical protein